MFDVSWGELLVVGAVGIALTGRRDLPMVCRLVGTQLGRVVGLLQGARARADQFAQHHELQKLQNELRSGLRELDQVKMELAVAASTQGVLGRTLGPTTAVANRQPRPSTMMTPPQQHNIADAATAVHPPLSQQPQPPLTGGGAAATSSSSSSLTPKMEFDFQIVEEGQRTTTSQPPPSVHSIHLPPVMQTERAVMEEEWEKQGIGFRARAERGQWEHHRGGNGPSPSSFLGNSNHASSWDTSRATGSELLEFLERQCLIFDQYDRVMGEKETELQQRITERRERTNKMRRSDTPENDNDTDK